MESDDYETNRNLTLMFFLEKLLDKPRSLHDLSCQFGTKGFSREMRQIAGGSQAGLRRFFNQYPSLFTIDGDIVNITTHSSSLSNDSRNYAQEGINIHIYLHMYWLDSLLFRIKNVLFTYLSSRVTLKIIGGKIKPHKVQYLLSKTFLLYNYAKIM